eukprot:gnl/TRDRNA2_/TRDRNA2_179585_c0_seq1.p1 gnl/TRDRNA2_/TRDRNA2_179585_c0~~gnl/TRDRNA2_/TRDRNA2_179585_c0_seq1.p1  ORF type:complete len:655 (-),score=88.58 gnl/TRDRNA2_/TRDRNA2_179585_c0_seq1:150-2114(-)
MSFAHTWYALSLLLSLNFTSHAASDCGSTPMAAGGKSYRWPVQNPALTAPVSVVFNYQQYSAPLHVEHMGQSLRIEMPPNFVGGFKLQRNGSMPDNSTEVYTLKHIEIRKPGKVPEGGQVLSHAVEAALVHKQVNGHYWANVVIPFDVANTVNIDMLSPLVDGANMPKTKGDIEPVLLAANQCLDLNNVLQGADFFSYWTTLPTTCDGGDTSTVNARQLLRNATITTSPTTYNSLLQAFHSMFDEPPLDSPKITWLMGSCRTTDTACLTKKPEDLTTELAAAQKVLQNAIKDEQDHKALVDEALTNFSKNVSGAYEVAVAARKELEASVAMASNAQSKYDELNSWVQAAKGQTFDQFRPASSAIWNSSDSTAHAPPNSSTAALQFSASGRRIHTHQQDCSALKQSPADIDTTKVFDPSALSTRLRQPLSFKEVEGAIKSLPLHLANFGHSLRVTSAAQGSASPLGALISDGVARGISYIDVHVPGQHAVDGKVSPVELQLVHLPADGNSASLAVAVPLDLDREDSENTWLKPLVGWLPGAYQDREVRGHKLLALHQDIRSGSTDSYFHYEGTLTTPPCRATKWFVLDTPGVISRKQLAALGTSLLTEGAAVPHQFNPTFVAQGTTQLYSHVTDTKKPTRFLGVQRLRGPHDIQM